MAIRVLHLVRDEDESGVSGTGTIAEVFEASDGTCIVRWLSNRASTNIYDNIKHMSIHGHEGKTRLVCVYDENPTETIKVEEKPELGDVENAIDQILKEEELKQLPDETGNRNK